MREARAALEEQAPSAIVKVKLTLVRTASVLSGLAARGVQAGSPYNRPFGDRAHRLLQRLVALNRQSGAELIVAVSPLHHAAESRYLPTDLSQALDQVARVTPLWDFTRADWLSDDPNYWKGDTAHYCRQYDARQHVQRSCAARVGVFRLHEGTGRISLLRSPALLGSSPRADGPL
jgi:hypothetical protein